MFIIILLIRLPRTFKAIPTVGVQSWKLLAACVKPAVLTNIARFPGTSVPPSTFELLPFAAKLKASYVGPAAAAVETSSKVWQALTTYHFLLLVEVAANPSLTLYSIVRNEMYSHQELEHKSWPDIPMASNKRTWRDLDGGLGLDRPGRCNCHRA